jgi:hypothetical protein
LVDVSTIDVTGEDEDGRLLIQLGRRTVEICAGLGLDDAGRREVAQVLRDALARARTPAGQSPAVAHRPHRYTFR